MSDKNILRKLHKRDIIGLEQIMNKYMTYVSVIVWNILKGTMQPEDAEEVVSDVFLAVWNQAETLHGDSLKSWLGSVARNKAKNKLREAVSNVPFDENILEIVSISQIERLNDRQFVMQAIDYLGATDREIFLRHYYYGQSVKDISIDLVMRDSAVKQRLRRGREKLKEYFSKGGL